jgi:flagellar motor switch protein FliN
MSINRLDGRMLKSFGELWSAALAEAPMPDPDVTLAAGQVRQGLTQELLPDCAQVLVATGTAGPADEWRWAMLVDAAAAAGADALAPFVSPSLREPDGTVNALMAIASFASSISDTILANLGAHHGWQVMQGWQGLIERCDLRELPEGALAEAPGMETMLVLSARPVLAEAIVRRQGEEALRISFLLDAPMVSSVVPQAQAVAPGRTGPTLGGQAAGAGAGGSAAPAGLAEAGDAAGAARRADSKVPVHRAAFENLSDRGAGGDMLPAGISLLLDVPLHMTVELGRTRRTIREVLSITPGAVVELDRLAGEPVDVLVNGKLLGKGEVVVINENFGVRITDIISPVERLKGLE